MWERGQTVRLLYWSQKAGAAALWERGMTSHRGGLKSVPIIYSFNSLPHNLANSKSHPPHYPCLIPPRYYAFCTLSLPPISFSSQWATIRPWYRSRLLNFASTQRLMTVPVGVDVTCLSPSTGNVATYWQCSLRGRDVVIIVQVGRSWTWLRIQVVTLSGWLLCKVMTRPHSLMWASLLLLLWHLR